jgi:hypothetical protein
MTARRFAARLGVTLLLIASAVLAQRWYGWNDALVLGGIDAESYEAIALAAPAMPAATTERLPFHHAQRWPGPYAVGLLAGGLRLDVREVFAWASGACLLGAILLMQAAFMRLGLSPWALAVCIALVVFHYSFRFYLVAPGMLPDALFILGLALTLVGLAGAKLPLLLAGILLAGLARQSVLLLLPGIAYWVLRGETWTRRSKPARSLTILAAVALAVAVYIGTGRIAEPFADPSNNLEAVTGLFAWLAGPAFSGADLAVFFGYAAIPLLIPSAMLAADCWHGHGAGAGVRWTGETGACLLMAAAIVCQPVLGGPAYTENGNAMRLAALALAPLAFAVGLRLKASGAAQIAPGRALAIILLLGAGSLHYNYTVLGPRTPAEFVLLQLTVAVLSAWLLFRPGVRT